MIFFVDILKSIAYICFVDMESSGHFMSAKKQIINTPLILKSMKVGTEVKTPALAVVSGEAIHDDDNPTLRKYPTTPPAGTAWSRDVMKCNAEDDIIWVKFYV